MQEVEVIESEFEPLLEFSIDAGAFDKRWEHCDILSTFVARVVSHNRLDPFKYSNLLSAALNELLETVFRTHKTVGRFNFTILRSGAADRVVLTVPCDAEEQRFYADTANAAKAPDAENKYIDYLFAEDSFDRCVGLYELAVNYRARFGVSVVEDRLVRLTVDIALEEEGEDRH